MIYNTPPPPLIGDINKDNQVDLADVILALKVVSGQNPEIRSDYISAGIDAGGDNKVGLEEALYILRDVSGLE